MKNKFDTLILLVDQDHGIVPEYQRQLYEASLLGVRKVFYIQVYENDSTNFARGYYMYEKLSETCQVLGLEENDSYAKILGPYLDDHQVSFSKPNSKYPSISESISYNEFRENHEEKLINRERVAKVLVRSNKR